MGDYISPPFGILTLASYIEHKNLDLEISVLDSQAKALNWEDLEDEIRKINPDVVAPSSLTTANAYVTLKTIEIAKKINSEIVTVAGGQHFSSLADKILPKYPDIDYIIRGEGEETLSELILFLKDSTKLREVKGVSYLSNNTVINNPSRNLISDLDSLPYPGYHFVKHHMSDYHFSLMSDRTKPFAIVEGGRGCRHACNFCTQWRYWCQQHRVKSSNRLANEIKFIHEKYNSGLFWLADDNIELDHRFEEFCDKIIHSNLDVSWFCQLRCDSIVKSENLIPKLRKAGCIWVLLGLDTQVKGVPNSWHRGWKNKSLGKKAIDILRENEIFSQGTFIIGNRNDSYESIEELRKYADWLDPDIATFMVLTPFPGTDIYEEAIINNWIEDWNWANYDMIHSIMPTKNLSRKEVQEELFRCYNHFFGSWSRRYRGISSTNPITRRTYLYLAKQAILTGLKNLFQG